MLYARSRYSRPRKSQHFECELSRELVLPQLKDWRNIRFLSFTPIWEWIVLARSWKISTSLSVELTHLQTSVQILSIGVRIVFLAEEQSSSKRGVLGMKLNWIWWWGSSSGDLGRLLSPFFAITSRFTLFQSCYNFLKIIHILLEYLERYNYE